MRKSYKLVAVLIVPALLVFAPAFAQQSRIADAATRQLALAGQAERDEAQRATVRRVLDRSDVRQLAATMALDMSDASSAVATLSGADLAAAAQRAQAVETALAGGSNTVVISTTTLLLVLIIVILIAQ